MGDKAIKIEHQEEDDDVEKQQQKQPPRKITKNFKGGQTRDYNFLKTVNSVDELHDFRFKNCCTFENSSRKALPTFTSLIMRCSRKRNYKPGKQCNFELLALRQKPENGTIDVYAHSAHNHPLMPEEKRASIRRVKEMMPAGNPPDIFRTEDNIEWKFIQTFPDYAQLQKFQRKSQCMTSTGRESNRRVRQPCCRKRSHNCQFKLLALKTTEKGYHVYAFGAHKHPAIKPRKKQQLAARGRQQKQQEQGMEVDEEEDDVDGQEEDEAEEGNEEEEEDDAIVIDDEEDKIKVQPKQEIKREASIEVIEIPMQNEATPRVETAKEKLQKAQAKAYYEWMAGFQPNQIETTVVELDIASVIKLVEMADQEIHQHPEKFAVLRPWLEAAIKKCMFKIEGFGAKYKELIGLF